MLLGKKKKIDRSVGELPRPSPSLDRSCFFELICSRPGLLFQADLQCQRFGARDRFETKNLQARTQSRIVKYAIGVSPQTSESFLG